MKRIRGQEFHQILQNIFGDVKGLNISEQLQTNCPRCTEENGGKPDNKFNLEINTGNKRVFRCWRCDEPKFSGSLGRLIRMYGSYSDYEMYKAYAGTFTDYAFEEDEKEYVPVKLPKEMISFSQLDITNPEHFEAYSYLIFDRKISRELILKFRLGFCITGKYEKRIIIPSYDVNGEVNYFVARNYDTENKKKKPYDNPKSDKDRIIFNEGFVNWDSLVFIVEGVFDMFSLPNAIPLLGKTLSTTLFFKLNELKPNVVILLDPDAYKNAIQLYYTLHNIYVDCEERVRLIKIPYEKDLDELRKNRGINEVIKSLYTARNLTIDDYFVNKLQKPYEYTRTRRYSPDTKYFARK